MEKIDLTKCNNLRYKAKINGDDDYGRICVENADTGLVFLRSDREDCYIATWHCDCPGVEGYCGRKVTDFKIVPRDPETYQDWQVGDIACEEAHRNARYEVIFRSGELVFFKDWNNYATNPFTCSEAFRRLGFRLVLTDIEKQIIEEGKKTELSTARTLWGQSFIGTGKIWRPQDGDICFVELIPEQQKLRAFKSEIKSDSTHEFKKFDPVLVRDSDGEPWRLGVFDSMRYKDNSVFKYTVMGCVPYAQCIPLNEKTEHLLGTTEDYKEEQP